MGSFVMVETEEELGWQAKVRLVEHIKEFLETLS